MSVPRAKAKKNKSGKTQAKPVDIVKTTSYLNLAIMVRTLYMVYGWRDKRLAKFIESYLVLMDEIADKRCTVNKFIDDTEELTGIDVKKLLDNIMG